MLFDEAKPFIRNGMTIRVIRIAKQSTWYDGGSREGKAYMVSRNDLNEITDSINCVGPVLHPGDELEILSNPDGTPWMHPDSQPDPSHDIPEFRVGDRVRLIEHDCTLGFTIGGVYSIVEYDSRDERFTIKNGGVHGYASPSCLKKLDYESNQINEPMAQKPTTTMNRIIKKIKDLTLSVDDRLLRKHGFEDEDGKMTDDADELMDQELREERWKARRVEIAVSLKLVEQSEK